MTGPEGFEREGDVTVSSTKGAVGHLLGAAGAIEAVFSILAVAENIVPPTLNLRDPDVQAGFNFVPLRAQEKTVNVALSNSFGFGGTNATLVFSKFYYLYSVMSGYPNFPASRLAGPFIWGFHDAKLVSKIPRAPGRDTFPCDTSMACHRCRKALDLAATQPLFRRDASKSLLTGSPLVVPARFRPFHLGTRTYAASDSTSKTVRSVPTASSSSSSSHSSGGSSSSSSSVRGRKEDVDVDEEASGNGILNKLKEKLQATARRTTHSYMRGGQEGWQGRAAAGRRGGRRGRRLVARW
ncbi:hypothetical protein VTK73DRAFT_5261 [Phialemonium thermophilum]|uniref:beta-ketoacyl-[acyl-carrier-protein] synthase I n=1 Tax=Phialemonium thermophilum TaxID=223376 RepID=A0ABR3V2C1_9PEZI